MIWSNYVTARRPHSAPPASGDASGRLLLRRSSCRNHHCIGSFLRCFCSLPRSSQPGLVTLARVLTSTKSRYVEFWRGRVVGEPTKIHTSAFSDQNRNNSNKDKTKTNRLMSIIKIWPNKISNQNFVRFSLPPR